MRRASPNELKEQVFPVMTARLSEAELGEWFPIPFDEVNDPWAAPEPSLGALVHLDAGEYAVLDYGRQSNQLIVRIPSDLDATSFLASWFREVPMPAARVLWRREGARLPRMIAAKRSSSKVTSYTREKPAKVAAGMAALALGAGLVYALVNRENTNSSDATATAVDPDHDRGADGRDTGNPDRT